MDISNLKELEQHSLTRKIPIIGSVKGKWLLEKVKKYNPSKILELGCANGYSGCILGSEGGEVTTIEINPNMANEAANTFKKLGITAKIIIGDGVKIVKNLTQQGVKFDFIFIDFFKKGYMQILEDCIKLLEKEGIMIADNITFKACQDFKKAILSDQRLKTNIIDIGDGMSISQLKK